MYRLVLFIVFTCLIFSQGSKLNTYGYFSFEADYNNSSESRWDLKMHHFNVINIYQIDKKWRLFSEVEWENGTLIETGHAHGEPVELASFEHHEEEAGHEEEGHSEEGFTGTGGISLERAWVEYRVSSKLKIKVGKLDTIPVTELPGMVIFFRQNQVFENQDALRLVMKKNRVIDKYLNIIFPKRQIIYFRNKYF